MSHHPEVIKPYRSATDFTTSIGEAMHITQIKNFFKKTNMRKGYKKQILDNNIKKFSRMVKNDIDMFSFIKILTQVNTNAVL